MSTFDEHPSGFSRFEIFTATAAVWLCLGFVSLFLEGASIAADVHKQVATALKDSGLLWYAVEVEGQHVVLHGAAETQAAATDALLKAREQMAVLNVDSRLILLPAAARCQRQLDLFSGASPVRFKSGSEELDEPSFESLERMAGVIRQCGHRVEVAAHADQRGDSEINQQLSERRAKIVARYLIRSGVVADKLLTAGHGETQPLVAGEPSGQANERVTFRVAGASA